VTIFLFLSLFFTLFLVSYSLRFPHRKGSERHGPCPALLVPPKPRLCMSFFLVIFPSVRQPKTGFSPCSDTLFFLACSFTLFLVSYSLRFPHRKGSERPGAYPILFVTQTPPSLYCTSFFGCTRHDQLTTRCRGPGRRWLHVAQA